MRQDPDWLSWQRFFEQRSLRKPVLLDPAERYPDVPASVARSLAIFQLGESGGGTIVAQVENSAIRGIDRRYARSMALFVREEHRHAELLALCVRMLGGELLRQNWTAGLFVFFRRLIGLRTKVMVLLAAEVIGLCYYNLLTSRLPDGRLRECLQEIADDERAHLRFHCDFLRTQLGGPLRRGLFVAAWRTTMTLAGWAVLFDHRSALRDLRIPRRALRSAWRGYAKLAERLALHGDRPDARRKPAVRAGFAVVANVEGKKALAPVPGQR